MVYNNGENRPTGDFSTVDIFIPFADSNGNYPLISGNFLPNELYCSYGENEQNFYSNILSGAQRQSNGNTLICEGTQGRIFEVNPNNEVVWEYITPTDGDVSFTQGEINFNNNDLFRAYRYPTDYPAFIGKDLTPGVPIELNPINQNCTIFTEDMVSNSNITDGRVFIVQNPISNQLKIENTLNSTIDVKVHSINGHLMTQTSSKEKQLIISTQDWQKGLYIIHVSQKASNQFSNFKILKF